MILKDVIIRKQFLDLHTFWLVVELEDDKGGIQRCVVDLAKGLEAEAVAGLVENLVQQIREV